LVRAVGRRICWLHVSDLHADVHKPHDYKLITDALIEDAGGLARDYSLHPDMIVFTGDLAHGGKKAEYSLANEFLTRLRDAFTPALTVDRLFLVPGNHDIDRARVSEADQVYRDTLSESDVTRIINEGGRTWTNFAGRLAGYRDYLKTKAPHLLQDRSRLHYAIPLKLGDLTVAVCGFNSAWTAYGDKGDRGKIHVGVDWQLNQMRDELAHASISIGLIHHPHGWIADPEATTLRRRIDAFDFFLNGHDHAEWVTDADTTAIAAGAAYSGGPANGYNFVVVDLDRGAAEVWLREWEPRGTGWTPARIAGKTDERGVWLVRHNKIFGSGPRSPRPSFPKTNTVIRGKPPIGRETERNDALAALGKSFMLLLHGAPGQGKTALARYIAASVRDAYPDGVVEVALMSERQIENVPKQIAAQLGDTESGNPLRLLESKKCLIILDSFETIYSASERDAIRVFLERLLAAAAASGTRIIITSQVQFELEGLAVQRTGPLEAAAAAEMFRSESGDVYADVGPRRFEQFSGPDGDLAGHPLSIKIVARFGDFRKVPFEDLVIAWREQFDKFVEFPTRALDVKTLSASFHLSYGFLNEIEKHAFMTMSLLPDGLLAGMTVSQIWPDREDEVLNALGVLEQRSLIESDRASRRVLPPLLLFAQKQRRDAEASDDMRRRDELARVAEKIDTFYDGFVGTNAPQEHDNDPTLKNQAIREHFHNIHASLDRRLKASTEIATLHAAETVLRLYWAYHNNLSGYRNAVASAADAVSYLSNAATVFDVHDRPADARTCRSYIATIWWLRGEVDRARKLLEEISSRAHGDPAEYKQVLEAQRALAHIEYTEGSIQRAVELFTLYAQTAANAGEWTTRAKCIVGLIDAHRKLEDYTSSEAAFKTLCETFEELPAMVQGNAVRGYAYALAMRNDFDEAERQYTRAVSLFEAVSPFGQAHCRRGLGDIYVATGRLELAEREFNLAMRLYAEARKNPSLGVALVEIGRGNLAAASEEHESAIQHFGNAVAFCESHNERFDLARACELSGAVLERIGRLSEAAGNYRRALQLYQLCDCTRPAERMHQTLARFP
jgi:tetratricopeptide (TPR) repeat protein/predicted MPP superfamily phosphohydrolase